MRLAIQCGAVCGALVSMATLLVTLTSFGKSVYENIFAHSTKPTCTPGSVCLYAENGTRHEWRPAHGRVQLATFDTASSSIVDRVSAFAAEVDACFIDTGRYVDREFLKTVPVHAGEANAKFLEAFGARMDQIAPAAQCATGP